MILFYQGKQNLYYAVDVENNINDSDKQKLSWLFSEAEYLNQDKLEGNFIGPRKEMITPWSTNAVEITQNMGVEGIKRIEEFNKVDSTEAQFDPMLRALYPQLDQSIFTIDKLPEPVIHIKDIAAYNSEEGLALSKDEIDYLNEVSDKILLKYLLPDRETAMAQLGIYGANYKLGVLMTLFIQMFRLT